MTDVTIREAKAADSAAIARLVTQLGYPSSTKEIEERLSNISGHPEYAVWVAEDSGRIVGLTGVYLNLGLEYDGLQGRLMGLVVDEPYRGRGIGKELLAWVERRLQERGVKTLSLTSGKQRIEAHEFYRSFGYEQTGFRFGKRL